MALKLKTIINSDGVEQKVLDGNFYLNLPQRIIYIGTQRDVGKTTNIVGQAMKNHKTIMFCGRYKYEDPNLWETVHAASEKYGVCLNWNKRSNVSLYEDGSVAAYYGSLSNAQEIKMKALGYKPVDYIVQDETQPIDNRYLNEGLIGGYEIKCMELIRGSLMKANKNVKTIYLSNIITALNPYFFNLHTSDGTSLFAHVSRSVNQSNVEGIDNITVNDSDIYFVHYPSGNKYLTAEQERMGKKQLIDFIKGLQRRVFKLSEKQYKMVIGLVPLLSNGIVSCYKIPHQTEYYRGFIYYWINHKAEQSSPKQFMDFDFKALPTYYNDLLAKGNLVTLMAEVDSDNMFGVV